jgi:hypothetical protein
MPLLRCRLAAGRAALSIRARPVRIEGERTPDRREEARMSKVVVFHQRDPTGVLIATYRTAEG